MKKFIINFAKLLLLTLFIYGFCIIVYYGFMAPQYKFTYNASFIDKMQRLREVESPRIVLVGNSNAAFGINSELIEQETGLPVVNLGLNASLGNAFHENMAKMHMKEGDIVVLLHTTFTYEDHIEVPEMALLTVENYFEYFPVFRTKDIVPLLRFLPRYLFKGTGLFLTGKGNEIPRDKFYSRLAFNKYGDVEVLHEHKQMAHKHTLQTILDPACKERINAFNSFCHENGAKLVVAGAPIYEEAGAPVDRQKYIDFSKYLQKELNCDVISDFSDYIYDEKYFFDTSEHLTTEGTELRTKQLIKDLKNAENLLP